MITAQSLPNAKGIVTRVVFHVSAVIAGGAAWQLWLAVRMRLVWLRPKT